MLILSPTMTFQTAVLEAKASILSLALKQNASQFLFWVKTVAMSMINKRKQGKQKKWPCVQTDSGRPLISPPIHPAWDITTNISFNMEKCASTGNRALCTRIYVITLMCFDSSASLNIKFYWIGNENSWGTRLDQQLWPFLLGDTTSHTAAFMHSKWHSFFTRPPTH